MFVRVDVSFSHRAAVERQTPCLAAEANVSEAQRRTFGLLRFGRRRRSHFVDGFLFTVAVAAMAAPATMTTVATPATMTVVAAVATVATEVEQTSEESATAMAAPAAMTIITPMTTVAAVATMAAVASFRRVGVRRDKGETDHGQEDDDSKSQSTIHSKFLQGTDTW